MRNTDTRSKDTSGFLADLLAWLSISSKNATRRYRAILSNLRLDLSILYAISSALASYYWFIEIKPI